MLMMQSRKRQVQRSYLLLVPALCHIVTKLKTVAISLVMTGSWLNRKTLLCILDLYPLSLTINLALCTYCSIYLTVCLCEAQSSYEPVKPEIERNQAAF